MSDRDLDDILGQSESITVVEAAPDIQEVMRGVTATWLMQAFRMDRITVRRKLKDLLPIKYGRGNVPIYDFVQACQYLVKPKVDIAEYIKGVKAEELPLDLQKDYWDAHMKKLRYEEAAGKTWRDEDVIELFGETFKGIKTATQLWASDIDTKTGLTPEQYEMLQKATDKMLDDIHKTLSDLKNKRHTKSVRGYREAENV